MSTDPEFRADLYSGTASDYDRYRPPYPKALFDDLRQRVPISGEGRLLDLACGTGQVAFPLASDFVAVVAVDQEAGSVAFGRAKAAAEGLSNLHWITGSAESVVIDGIFEMVAIGNAFHRLKRSVVAERILSWLQPGGCVVLVWAGTPTEGSRRWQKELENLFVEWMDRLGTSDRVPVTWMDAIRADSHEQVLRRAGLEYLGKFEFVEDQTWTVESLIGFAYSTSMLNRQAQGSASAEFEREVAVRLGPYAQDGGLMASASYAYELARRPEHS